MNMMIEKEKGKIDEMSEKKKRREQEKILGDW